MSEIKNYKLEVYLAINAPHSEDEALAYIEEKINKIFHPKIGISSIKTFERVNSWQEISKNTGKKDTNNKNAEILRRFCEIIRRNNADNNNRCTELMIFDRSLDSDAIKYIESKIQCHYEDMVNYTKLLIKLLCEDYEIISWGEHRVTIKFNDSKILVRVEI